MTRWEITLRLKDTFSDTELKDWLNLFNFPACNLTRVEGSSYCLTAERFEKLTDRDEVAESARKHVKMMAAIAKINSNADFQRRKASHDKDVISSIRENLGDKANVTANETVFLDVVNGVTVEVCGSTAIVQDENGNIVSQEKHERQADWHDDYLNRCDFWINNPVIFKALDCFADKTTPRTLRLVYEIICDDEGNEEALYKNNGWVTKKELRAFTHSVSHPHMEGEALHAIPKDNYTPMKLDEAKKFLAKRLLKPWLIKKGDSQVRGTMMAFNKFANGKVVERGRIINVFGLVRQIQS